MIFSAFTDILSRPFEEALDALAGLGLTTIDLRSRIGEHNVDTLTGEAAKQVRSAVASRGLKVGCVASWGVNVLNGPYDPADVAYRQAMRERVTHLAELAAMMDAPSVRVYSFKRPTGRAIGEADRADNAAFLSELAELCRPAGRTLIIENEPPTLTSTCAELGDLMRRGVPANLKVNWDIVNGWRAGEVPWAQGVFDSLRGHVAQVHVKGARATPDGGFASMALPGHDDVPHEQLIRTLREAGFDGVITIDPHYPQFAPQDKLAGYDDSVLEVVRRTLAHLGRFTGAPHA
ncbi:MAG: sugar phosphate isomerase/epimerase [Phycisphaeraceae bacterium]|nr:sugar phosphate isomerase/epimerase [Phycisphaeraceae bacterium]